MKNPSTKILRLARCAKRLRGFTLIELLVVVAIIGILVAILVPALNSARNQALGTKTLSRMRNIGSAYLLYMSDSYTVPLVSQTNPNASDAALMWSIQTAIAPYLDLKETGDLRFANPVWWDAFAEINGERTQGGGEENLYYPDPKAWAGGPPRNRTAGWYFNYNAHSTYTDTNGSTKAGFTRLNQIAQLSKTAIMFSRRMDSSGTNAWNTWSDGRKFSAANPRSYGAKRFTFYFDGHNEVQIINSTNYMASAIFNY
jgi:prepilin-type N-terminal cleavage/methylation domain-containing protein